MKDLDPATLAESYTWIDLALHGQTYDRERDLVFALPAGTRAIPNAHALAARRYFEEWGPFAGASEASLRAYADLIAGKCGGRPEDIATLLMEAARRGRFPDGQRMQTGGPTLAGVIHYLARCTDPQKRRVISALHRHSYSFMKTEEDVMMALLNFRLEQMGRRSDA